MSHRILFLIFAFFCLHTQHAHAGKSSLDLAEQYLRQWQTYKAEKQLKTLSASLFKTGRYYYLLGKLQYFQGKYKEAEKSLRKALSKEHFQKNSMVQSLLATQKIEKNYQRMESKHFVILFPPGKAKMLGFYAIEALEMAYQRLGKVFGHFPPTKVRVQILEDAIQLAHMSPLTEADIERTGTIALCKYNRIMLTSPLALLRGYRWLDTLVHEYTHLLINRVAPGIPIWLHEGLARYAETLWRRKKPNALAPYAETLLARALKTNRFITFKQMHPSMAKLPSQKDAAQAYAQVYTVILYLVKKYGQQSIFKVLSFVAKGETIPKAFEKVVQMDFATFLQQWKKDLATLGLKEHKGVSQEKKILKSRRNQQKKAKEDKTKDFWTKPKTSKELGARFLRLAEMLRARSRWKAALLEYRKAEKYWKNKNPSLQSKISLTLIRLRKYKEVIKTVRFSLKLYPNYVTSFYRMGRAYFHLKKYKQAKLAFEHVNQINPFHPGIHRYLQVIYKKLGKPEKSKQEAKVISILRGMD